MVCMGTEYRAVRLAKAAAAGYPEAEEQNQWDDEGYGYGIWRFVDGVAVEFLASDGGEPEDNSFTRDGAWIAPALQAAYDLGTRE